MHISGDYVAILIAICLAGFSLWASKRKHKDEAARAFINTLSIPPNPEDDLSFRQMRDNLFLISVFTAREKEDHAASPLPLDIVKLIRDSIPNMTSPDILRREEQIKGVLRKNNRPVDLHDPHLVGHKANARNGHTRP